jgi:hypothetical protein
MGKILLEADRAHVEGLRISEELFAFSAEGL